MTEVLQGIRRTVGVAPNQKDPVLVDTLRALVEPMRRDAPGDVRAQALICLGFASGCRRPEFVGLAVGDLSFGDDGLELTIRRSKTDQEGLGRKWASRTAAAPGRALCARCATGSTYRCSTRARCSAPSTALARSSPRA